MLEPEVPDPEELDLEKLDPEELKELLLATTAQRADESFFVEPRLHPAIELQRHYDRSQPRQRARLKAALIAAVAEWRRRAHGLENLRFLAQAAASLRARSTAAHFERILERGDGLLRPARGAGGDRDARRQAEVAGAVVATIAGFAPGERLGALLERLFFTPGLRPQLAGLLFQGLCRSRREQLPRHLERYLRLTEGADVHHFADPIFLRLFVESMTPAALAAVWKELDRRLRDFLLRSLGTLDSAGSPDLFFAIEEEGATLHVEAAGRHELFELRSDTVGDRFEDLHTAYTRMKPPPLPLGPS